MQFNQIKFNAIVEAAKKAAPADWAHKIQNAADILLDNPYTHFDGHGLLILSDSGQTYYANGECQCKAHRFGQPCWHRIAAKLVKRYFEAGH